MTATRPYSTVENPVRAHDTPDAGGRTAVRAVLLGAGFVLSLCCGLSGSWAAGRPSPKPWPDAKVPVLNSYPRVKETIYLNFRGTKGGALPHSGKRIHGKDDDPHSFSAQELGDIKAVWEQVAEKLVPFPVNVTTEARRYDYAFENQNHRTIVTFSASHRGASWSGAWFNGPEGGFCSIAPYRTIAGIGRAAGHELGHSLGLDHDQVRPVKLGKTTWGPMFTGGSGLCQWSKNEGLHCDYARRQRDALEVISGPRNGLGYRTDDHGNEHMTASLLRPGKTEPAGIIERNTDVDVFRFTTAGGPFVISIRPPDFRPVTLDVLAELYDQSGKRVLVSDPKGDEFGARIRMDEATPAGTYFVHISGTGQGTPGVDGYSDYGSLGTYHIEAEYRPAPSQRDVVRGLTATKGKGGFTTRHVGLLQLPADGLYTFHATARSTLFIRQTLVVSHDGTGGEKSGALFLSAGLQPMRLDCDVASGPLAIEYSGPGIARKPVPALVLYPAPTSPSAPIAKDDAYTVVSEELRVRAQCGVLANDRELDDDPLQAQLVSGVRHGKLALKPDGSFVYAPDGSLKDGALDRFTYRVSDGKNLSRIATVEFAVWGPRVDFRRFRLHNYTGIGLSYGSRIEDEGRTLRLNASDPSKKIFLPYRVTPYTVLAFDFHGITEGEYHQIGFINNKIGVDPTKLFRVWGTCGRRGPRRFEAIGDIKDYINGSGSYEIPVGKHFTGPMQAICFGNWSEEKRKGDPGDPATQHVKRVAECTFSNIRIYESEFPHYSYTSTHKGPKPLPRPSGIRVVGDIAKAFALARFEERKEGYRAHVPLCGVFSGGHDDWYLRFEIVKDLGLPGRSPTRLLQDNAGQRLVFSLPKDMSVESAAFVLRVTDGASRLEYPLKLTWRPERRELSARH